MSILINGFVLGWSVAWPPGPVNAEMIRRGLLPREQGGAFWETWRVGLGACTGDFLWAFAVAAGAGALLNEPGVRIALGATSLVLLLVLSGCLESRPRREESRRSRANETSTRQGRLLARIALCHVESMEHRILACRGGQPADPNGHGIIFELADARMCCGPRCAHVDARALR